jgi:hypothetical protein
MKAMMRKNRDLILNAALHYVAMGFAVVPLCSVNRELTGERLKESGKLLVDYRLLLRPLRDENSIREFFEQYPSGNVGIVTGEKAGLVVIDVDGDRGGFQSMKQFNFPETLTSETGNGLHLYYRHPGRSLKVPTSHDGLAAGIDTKGEHAYVVAPPSIHSSGWRYRWRDTRMPIRDLPSESLELILRLSHRSFARASARGIIVKHVIFPFLTWVNRFSRRATPNGGDS